MKPIIYQLVVRHFGNVNVTNRPDGTLAENGCGKFNDITPAALQSLREMGVTHVWLTGCLRQATLTDYSEIGLPADDPDIVKGRAGSFYAVRDYYDVCPDYAAEPARRMAEFEALTQRIHAAGMRAMIDFIPNHVSRAHASTVRPRETFGAGDDVSQFFSPANHFFYLTEPPGQSLRLSKPEKWNPAGVTFDGRFAPEDGSPGRPPKATGNNVASPQPGVDDWYETVKLNYGFNFVTQEKHYEPRPRTWDAMDAILAYWQARGVDGFRCDFAHYVPAEAWAFLIARARARDAAAYFFAEAYPWEGSGDPVHGLDELLRAGFDAVYHYQSYNALKGIYTDGRVDDYEREMTGQTEAMRDGYVNYLENHDERRVASPIVRGRGPGDSGFGSAAAGYQLAPLQFLYGRGAVLLYNGQEVGEPGAGLAGFGGDNGRTTLYDYWAMPEFAKWVNEHRYDGGGLSDEQRALRAFYGALLRLCQHPAAAQGGYWGLRHCNRPEIFADCPPDLYAFARFRAGADTGTGEALVVVANFCPGHDLSGRVRLPRELLALTNFPRDVTVKLALDRRGAQDLPIVEMPSERLATEGFAVALPHQSSHVYWIG